MKHVFRFLTGLTTLSLLYGILFVAGNAWYWVGAISHNPRDIVMETFVLAPIVLNIANASVIWILYRACKGMYLVGWAILSDIESSLKHKRDKRLEAKARELREKERILAAHGLDFKP